MKIALNIAIEILVDRINIRSLVVLYSRVMKLDLKLLVNL